MNVTRATAILIGVLSLATACSGGDPVGERDGTDPPGAGCDGSCATATSRLTVADVEQVLAQGIFEAQARDALATLAVVDRVGNVLAVYRMGDAADHPVLIDVSGNALDVGGLEGLQLPVDALPVSIDDQAAIAKAVTGAYLSSEGNAFSTRTASQIVQEHFNPKETAQPSGPLFGVQFSQLACSDFMSRFDGVGTSPGPHRSPLGLSADPGGFPLYKGGTVVGGVGVIADGLYTLDADISDSDSDLDESIAYAATFGFAAPADRRGDAITLDGKTARFSDVAFSDLASDPEAAPSFAAIAPAVGSLVTVRGYSDGVIRAGTAFGQPESGIRPDGGSLFPGADAFVFVDAADAPRFPPRAGTDAAALGADALTQAEVRTLLRSALSIANRARAQIRLPLGSQARVTISVVDTQGEILGMARTRDAPVFGADVSLQKARTAVFFSSDTAAGFLSTLPDAKYVALSDDAVAIADEIAIDGYVERARQFVAIPSAFGDGATAYSTRAIGNLSRPFYPDGIDGSRAGPFSKRFDNWSIFSDGIQLDVALNGILQHVLFVAANFPPGDVELLSGCAGYDIDLAAGGSPPLVPNVRIGNGLQIFPGGVPLFRGDTLVGGVGVSGDGVDQDDMVAFLGTATASDRLEGEIGNAPASRRADTLTPQGVRLKYVQCPQAPFVDDDSQNVCNGR
jgi:uncharacterized protein GlcG (DUF336 family)